MTAGSRLNFFIHHVTAHIPRDFFKGAVCTLGEDILTRRETFTDFYSFFFFCLFTPKPLFN